MLKKQTTKEPKKILPDNAEDNIPEIGKPGDEEEIKSSKPSKIESKKETISKIPLWLQFETPDKEGRKIKVYQGKAGIMRTKLLKQRLLPIYIPRDPGENVSVKQPIRLNGYGLMLPKNTYVDVPEQIAQIIKKSRNQVDFAYAQIAAEVGMDRPTTKEKPVPLADALN